MLKEANEYEGIMKASSLDDVKLSKHTEKLLDAFRSTTPSAKSIRTVLHTYGNPIDFDVFEHADFGFIQTTTRHFLDLTEGPRNPLLGSLKEHTTEIALAFQNGVFKITKKPKPRLPMCTHIPQLKSFIETLLLSPNWKISLSIPEV
ncbi:hypothetical protein BDF20DRAFT_579931 [Mycotypha africana]|uniref:uncharacterized protein n=1 Tax=Mycotypha africana TaxID=64632 RepID=UPI00230008EF|nr:uncharacterized protein BDF20DRAFT_579931 [Mycotypha africana]KAI8977659.1 hypothetical protein BDF20DRAFT_579931 [Mycotypha africana]